MWIQRSSSSPPASSSSTLWRPEAESRFASTQPALPAPTTMKSNSFEPVMGHASWVMGSDYGAYARMTHYVRPVMIADRRSARIRMRRNAIPGAAFLVMVALASVCSAQGWKPEKPVEIIVPTTPGGSVDLTARLLQKIFQETGLVKVPVTVVNKPGAGGAISLVY